MREHGVILPYKQAWLGKEVSQVILYGSEVANYDLLVWYTSKVVETNPGSVVIVDKYNEQFRRAFFSFRACVLGLKKGCRPLLLLNGTRLFGKYRGPLLGMTNKDGNNGFFYIAFAIVDNETDTNRTLVPVHSLGCIIRG